MKIGITDFARGRNVPESGFSHYDGRWGELVELVEKHFDNHEKGDNDGVVLVNVPAEGFYCGVVVVDEDTPLVTKFEARREDEDPFLQTLALVPKPPAKVVQVVLYHHSILGKDGNGLDEWEVVSINARASEEPETPSPVAMARNYLELPGGTKTEYTAEQFAKAIICWSRRANVKI